MELRKCTNCKVKFVRRAEDTIYGAESFLCAKCLQQKENLFLKSLNSHIEMCIKCGKIFKRTKPYQLTCSDECQEFYDQESREFEQKLNGICPDCGVKVRLISNDTGNKKYALCEACKLTRRKRSEESKKEKKPLAFKKRPKGISLEEQIRRMEWKRVWDDSGWDYYLRGHKGNRI